MDYSYSQSSQVKRSFTETVNDIANKIELECFPDEDKDLAKEMILIISEIMWLPPSAPVRIAKIDVSAKFVGEIYEKITHEHVCYVLNALKNISDKIKFKKTYCRTMLYNSVFEIETDTQIQANKILGA